MALSGWQVKVITIDRVAPHLAHGGPSVHQGGRNRGLRSLGLAPDHGSRGTRPWSGEGPHPNVPLPCGAYQVTGPAVLPRDELGELLPGAPLQVPYLGGQAVLAHSLQH